MLVLVLATAIIRLVRFAILFIVSLNGLLRCMQKVNYGPLNVPGRRNLLYDGRGQHTTRDTRPVPDARARVLQNERPHGQQSELRELFWLNYLTPRSINSEDFSGNLVVPSICYRAFEMLVKKYAG